MLFFTSYGGGILYWLGWLFAPRITVAIIATILYHQNNWILIIMSWMFALIGEFAEKKTVKFI